MQRLLNDSPETGPGDRTPSLSERDVELLRHLADGMSTSRTATAMGVSINTVRTRVQRVLTKLQVARRDEAVTRGRELGVV